MTTQDDFELFWWSCPESMRNGKPDARKAYWKRREKCSHKQIIGRLGLWLLTGVRREDWYHLPWAQKWLNRYFEDVEGEKLAPEEGSPEWWRNRCEEALNNRFMRERFNNNHRNYCPAYIRAEYPDLYPKLRAVE